MHADVLKDQFRAACLISGFLQKKLSREEEKELDAWILESERNMQIFEDVTEEDAINDFLQWYNECDVEKNLQKAKLRLNKPSRVIRLWKYAAVACLAITVGLAIYFIGFHHDQEKPLPVAKNQAAAADILPGTSVATLKMDNGSIITLGNQDTMINEHVRIKEGQVVYSHSTEVAMHEISIPRKGFYKLLLPDGTKVWLNSESSIRYPSAFTGKERKVEVSGETYFEVAKDALKPFIASVNGLEVTALGTAFNINAYPNEAILRTTLVEGSIKITKDAKEKMVKPGQQLRINGQEWKLVNIPIAGVIAWTQNQFKFKDTPLPELMRMVERWYDAKVIFEDNVNYHFNGTIDRDVPVSRLLYLLEKTNMVHFTIEGNTITVKK